LEHVSLEEWTQFESVEVATSAYIDHNRHRVRACAEALTHLSKSYFGYHVATQGPTPHGPCAGSNLGGWWSRPNQLGATSVRWIEVTK